MDIAAKKVELIEWLAKFQDESLLEKIESLKKEAFIESYKTKINPMTAQQYKSMLTQAEEDYKNGRVTLQEDLEKESENW